MAREALGCLLQLEIPTRFVRGNGETAILAEIRGADPSVAEQLRDVIRWNAREFQHQYEHVVAAWPATTRLDVPELGSVLFCHATPTSDTEIFTRLTPAERLVETFQSGQAEVVVCGHTHMQFDRMIGGVRVLNAGSVGMPFGEAGAYWLLCGRRIEFRRTTYDLRAAAARVRGTGYPRATEFAEQSILNPPREAEMLARFSPA